MPENPYASPVTPAEVVPGAELDSQELPIASQGKRFLNLIIDNILIQIMSTVGGVVIGALYASLKIASNSPITPTNQFRLQMFSMAIGMILTLCYFVFTEVVFQRTPAKYLTGTRVVTADGGRPSVGQIVGRSFARFIPFEAFSFLVGKNPVGWHDSLSGTRVVSKR